MGKNNVVKLNQDVQHHYIDRDEMWDAKQIYLYLGCLRYLRWQINRSVNYVCNVTGYKFKVGCDQEAQLMMMMLFLFK